MQSVELAPGSPRFDQKETHLSVRISEMNACGGLIACAHNSENWISKISHQLLGGVYIKFAF